MKPEGIRGVIAERGLEGAVIYLAEAAEAGTADQAHEQNSVLYSLQGKIEQLEDRPSPVTHADFDAWGNRVNDLEKRIAALETSKTEQPAVTSGNGEQ